MSKEFVMNIDELINQRAELIKKRGVSNLALGINESFTGLLNFLITDDESGVQQYLREFTLISEEQIWTPFSSKTIPRSGFTTGVLADYLFEYSGNTEVRAYAKDLFHHLEYKNGHLHDSTITIGRINPLVLNITAFSMLYDDDHQVLKRKLNFLIRSLRKDGLFPYIMPSGLQKIYHNFFQENKIYRKFYGDGSIFFFDISHHFYILYILSKVYQRSSHIFDIKDLTKIEMALRVGLTHLRRNNAQEPIPLYHRFCNFNDTTSLFLSLRPIHVFLRDSHAIDEVKGIMVKNMMPKNDKFIFRPLFNFSDNQFILPAIWMDDAWKIFLLKEYEAHSINSH